MTTDDVFNVCIDERNRWRVDDHVEHITSYHFLFLPLILSVQKNLLTNKLGPAR